MPTITISKAEVTKKGKTTKRYPNLNTVLMVEKVLQDHQDQPLKLPELKRLLPKQVMHETLKVVLEYLWRSGKIIYGPKGVQWIYTEPEHLKQLLEDTLEI